MTSLLNNAPPYLVIEMKTERKIIILTPVKNEAWILPLFCKSASLWADNIIIADQGSTDGSREIAQTFQKVVLIDNSSTDLDENYRDKILIEKAREITGANAILFRLDADEIITPNFDSYEWNEIRNSPAGTFWRFKWLQIYPDFKNYWENNTAFGAFIDDGRDYTEHGIIHAREFFPHKESDTLREAKKIGIMHFQFVDWARMQSKHRYYQCFEHINFPNKSVIDIYRTYHWMYNKNLPKQKIPKQWIDKYYDAGIDIQDITIEKNYWWDGKIIEYFNDYTPEYFRHIETYKPGRLLISKGKNVRDKLLLVYLSITKTLYNRNHGFLNRVVKRVDNILRNKLHF